MLLNKKLDNAIVDESNDEVRTKDLLVSSHKMKKEQVEIEEVSSEGEKSGEENINIKKILKGLEFDVQKFKEPP